jgi:hypothetical protein
MSGAAGGAVAAAAYVAIANAIKASGTVVRVEPDAFMEILRRTERPLVVYSPAGFLTRNKYLTSYKGLCFYTKTATELTLPNSVEIVQANKIWVPD